MKIESTADKSVFYIANIETTRIEHKRVIQARRWICDGKFSSRCIFFDTYSLGEDRYRVPSAKRFNSMKEAYDFAYGLLMTDISPEDEVCSPKTALVFEVTEKSEREIKPAFMEN